MLHVQHLRKSYATTAVLRDVTFVLNDTERVGLVGANGTGKSTLLRCIVGIEAPDAGTIVLSPPGARVGYLPQSFAHDDGRTIADVIDDARRGLGEYAHAGQTERVLSGLGLGGLDRGLSASQLSGGQKTRLGLAALLLGEPDVLILDEPTNHLDVDALEWLETFVQSYPKCVLLVSHDRAFLDATVDRVLYLDPESRTVQSYTGGYSAFAAARLHERELHEMKWRRQQEYIDDTQRDISRMKSGARSIEMSTTARQPGLRKLARKKAALAKSREKKLERYVASDERVERPGLRWPIKLDFGAPPPGGRALLAMEDVGFAYAGQKPLLEHVSFELRYGQRLALAGPNGSGKTTLLRLIEGTLAPSTGAIRLGANVRLGVMAQEQETLEPELTVLETVLRERPTSEQDARSFLPAFLFSGDSVFKKVGTCSLGERSRLQLARLVLRGCNLLLLDEPINHLDLESREHFLDALQAFEGSVVLVTHDRFVLRSFSRRVLEVRDGRVSALEVAPAARSR